MLLQRNQPIISHSHKLGYRLVGSGKTRLHQLGARSKSTATENILTKKSIHHYTRVITPKRVTSGEAHLGNLALGQQSSEETSQRWRAVGDIESNKTGLGLEHRTSHTNSNVLAAELTDQMKLE